MQLLTVTCILLVLSDKGKGMQSLSEQPLVGEEHCLTTPITAAKEIRGLLELQLICPVVTRITRMGQNNAVCYLTYLQSLVLFVEEI